LGAFALFFGALLATLLATSRTIILRVASRCMLATTFAGTLFHTLIPVSVVCHINPPLFCDRLKLSGRQECGLGNFALQSSCQTRTSLNIQWNDGEALDVSIQTIQARIKAEQGADGRRQTAGRRQQE
jgi:hypothetical protein